MSGRQQEGLARLPQTKHFVQPRTALSVAISSNVMQEILWISL